MSGSYATTPKSFRKQSIGRVRHFQEGARGPVGGDGALDRRRQGGDLGRDFGAERAFFGAPNVGGRRGVLCGERECAIMGA